MWRGYTISPNGLLSFIFLAFHFKEKCWLGHKVSQRPTYVGSVRLLHACLTRPGRLVSRVNQRSTLFHCTDSFVICASERWKTVWPPSGIQVIWKVIWWMGGTALPCFLFFFALARQIFSELSGSALTLWDQVLLLLACVQVLQSARSRLTSAWKCFPTGPCLLSIALSSMVGLLWSVFPFEKKILLTASPFCQHLPRFIHMPLGFLPPSIYTFATLWDTPAVVLQNRLDWHCTTGALHNKMRITLRLFYGAIWSKSVRLSVLRPSRAAGFVVSSTFLCATVKSQTKSKCLCEEPEILKTLWVSLVSSRHST